MKFLTIEEFFNWLMGHEQVDPAYVIKLKDEWSCLTFGQAGKVTEAVPSKEWPRLWDAYDERVAIMAEGREVRDGELAEAWESVLKGYEDGKNQKIREG